jgi:hypothetical protein
MYTLLSAKALDKLSLGDWIDLDAGNQPLFTLFLRYSNVLLQLSNSSSLEQGWASINDFPVTLRTSGVKLNDYLATAADNTIKLYSETPVKANNSEEPNYVRSLFANDYGFKQKLINRNLHPDSELAPDQQLDLLISHEEIEDYQSIVDNALFTVNGLLHQAEAIDQGIMIYEGARTIVKADDNRVGILDFKALGGVKTYPFQDDWLVIHEGKDVSKTAYFEFPFSLDGKSVLLSMGGFLYFIDPVVDYVGGNKVKVNFRFIDLVSQYYANVDMIYRPDDFPLTKFTRVDDLVNTAEIYTEDYIRATMHLSQSFFIVVNTPRITVARTRLDKLFDAGNYRTVGKNYPDLPVRIGHGYLPEFNVLERERFYVLSCPHYLTKNAIRHTVPADDIRYTRNMDYGYHPTDHAEAAQLLITASL